MPPEEQRVRFLQRHFKEQRFKRQLWSPVLRKSDFWVYRTLDCPSPRRPPYARPPRSEHIEIIHRPRLCRCEMTRDSVNKIPSKGSVVYL